MGLVRLMPKKGAVVTPVAADERHDLLAVRTMFEVESVASLTADGGGLDALAEPLRVRLDEQRAALDAGDLLAFAAADYAFHATVILAGGNAVVRELLATLAPRLARLTHQACLDRPWSLPNCSGARDARRAGR
ncbi:GntR family transcriptional regulator [Tessaracoccus sp. HDW20]|uniref:FCD domain-containing protein n=1 Tax=Tessaracoccus coleopterorum TaxID=2714950 RepID=UPI0018D29AA8|nr:FCD domain-containing protein [Tessaracoccus coleopterorum]NHB86106.1 GntR family transcriptional regulator [Tessaracoccus coleopterorum]